MLRQNHDETLENDEEEIFLVGLGCLQTFFHFLHLRLRNSLQNLHKTQSRSQMLVRYFVLVGTGKCFYRRSKYRSKKPFIFFPSLPSKVIIFATLLIPVRHSSHTVPFLILVFAPLHLFYLFIFNFPFLFPLPSFFFHIFALLSFHIP